MAISISDWVPRTPGLYNVTFFDDNIKTTVTSSSDVVDSWIDSILRLHRHRLHRLVVGLDVEWRPSFTPRVRNRVAVLQLCVGRQCLVFQILQSDGIPQSLADFLGDSSFTFVGVGIVKDVKKLEEDYGLWVEKTVELGYVAEERAGIRRNAGLREIVREVMEVDMVKPKMVTMSMWDADWLSYEQIMYACVDAFVSFEVGVRLNAFNYM